MSVHFTGDTCTYLHKDDHRDGTYHKSQWTITEHEERASFDEAHTEGWIDGAVAWGLHVIDERAGYLGVDRDHTTRVFIAKFVDSKTDGEWHGYPVDHRRGRWDRPSATIARLWLDRGLVRAAVMRKVLQGAPCSL